MALGSSLSAQIDKAAKGGIAAILREDRKRGRASEGDVIRAVVRLGLPLLAQMSPEDRIALYAQILRGE